MRKKQAKKQRNEHEPAPPRKGIVHGKAKHGYEPLPPGSQPYSNDSDVSNENDPSQKYDDTDDRDP